MAKAKDKAREALSYISAIQSILEKYPDLEHLDTELANQANNGIEFLINILKELGQYDRMVQWLANYIVYLVPALEVVVKGILLANLKIACSVDPRIPRYMRKRSKDVPKIDADDVESRGVLLKRHLHSVTKEDTTILVFLRLKKKRFMTQKRRKNR